MVKSWPMPVNSTVCGVPAALSDTLSAPARVPPAVGLKVTDIVQFAPASTVFPQVLD